MDETAHAFDARSLTNRSTWNFENLVSLAYSNHPAMVVARAQLDASRAAIKTAGGRPNPTIGFTPGYNFNASSLPNPWIPGATIDFPIETAGKRSKRLEQANYLYLATRYASATAAWQVRSNLRLALIELVTAGRRAASLTEQIAGHGRLLELFQQRVTAGAAAPNELLPIRVVQIRLQGDLAAAHSAATLARSHVAEALGVPARALEGVQFAEDIVKIDAPPTAEARAAALRGRSDLLAQLAKYEAAQAALRLEIAKQYPDLHLGSGYQWDQGESKWNLSASLELPLLNRNQGPIAEAEARRVEVGAQLMELQARAIAEIDGAFRQLATAQEQLDQTRRSLEALREQSRLTAQRLAAGAADQFELETAKLEESAAAVTLVDVEARFLNAAAQVESALQANFATEPSPK